MSLVAVNFDLISTNSYTEDITNSPSGTLQGTLNGNPYDIIKSSTSNSKIFETYAPDVLKDHTNKIDNYNKEMQGYIDVLDGIKAVADSDPTKLTQADETRWNETVTKITTLQGTISNLEKLEKTFSEIRAEARDTDEDKNDLPDIVDYAICQRLKSASTGDLVKYGLVKLINQKDVVVYVPKNNSPNGPDSGQVNDEQGYLATGKQI